MDAVVRVMQLCNFPGAKVLNPLNSFRCAEVVFATVNVLLCVAVTGSTQKDKNLVYLFAGLVGVCFGWMFPSQHMLNADGPHPHGAGDVFIFTAMTQAETQRGLSIVSFFLRRDRCMRTGR